MSYHDPHSFPVSPRAHVRVSYRREPNYLERVGNSLVGSVLGVVFILGASCLLFLNEGRNVHTYDMLVEAQELCNPLRSPDHVYDSLNNKLVYVSGQLATAEPLLDSSFGVSKMAARLRRNVDMYQWVEETETREYKEPDGVVRTERLYTYRTMWKDHVVNSISFDDRRYHENPSLMSVEKMEFTAVAKLGEFVLSKEAVLKIENWKRVILDPSVRYGGGFDVYNNMIYFGHPHNPQVGDVRVWFESAGNTEPGQEDEISIVARQSSRAVLTTYTTLSGYDMLFVYMERMPMEEVFAREHQSNKLLTWALRAVGWVLACVGFNLTINIVVTLFDWVPVVRELLALGSLILSVVLATSLSLLVIAVAWIRYRPLYGLAVLLGACIPLVVPRLFTNKEKDG